MIKRALKITCDGEEKILGSKQRRVCVVCAPFALLCLDWIRCRVSGRLSVDVWILFGGALVGFHQKKSNNSLSHIPKN